MIVYTCDDHIGHWPVPTASVVVAADEKSARALLLAALIRCGLDPTNTEFTLKELDTAAPGAHVLQDGEY